MGSTYLSFMYQFSMGVSGQQVAFPHRVTKEPRFLWISWFYLPLGSQHHLLLTIRKGNEMDTIFQHVEGRAIPIFFLHSIVENQSYSCTWMQKVLQNVFPVGYLLPSRNTTPQKKDHTFLVDGQPSLSNFFLSHTS